MNRNSNKLKGLVMIVQALIPITSGMAIIVLLAALVFDVNDLVQGPVTQVRRSIAVISAQAAHTGDAIMSTLAPLGNIEHK